MLFRAYVLKRRLMIGGFSLDAHSSTGFDNRSTGTVPHPLPSLEKPGNDSFGLTKLENWLTSVTDAVPYP
jgi:hypothetical protein